jgi:hypothetical protein
MGAEGEAAVHRNASDRARDSLHSLCRSCILMMVRYLIVEPGCFAHRYTNSFEDVVDPRKIVQRTT